MSPSTYLSPTQLSSLRRRLADELLDRSSVAPGAAQDVAWDVCRPDFGGAYLSNVQARADARGLRAELDAVVERMGAAVVSAQDVGVRLALPTHEAARAENEKLRAGWEASIRRRISPYGATLTRRDEQYVVTAPPQWIERLRAELAVTNASIIVEASS